METHTSKALAKRSADTALMPPPPAPKRIKRPAKVLDEDVYSEALSHIIARDFFPGLLETQTQEEYLAALDSKNNAWIREAGSRLRQVMTPGPDGRRRIGRRGVSMTPRRGTVLGGTPVGQNLADTPRGWTGATPLSSTPSGRNNDFAPEEKPEVDVNISLSAFQSRYTSEDNESFNALLDTQNVKRAAKYTFFHNGNKIPTLRQIALRAREQKLLESEVAASTALIRTGDASKETGVEVAVRPSQDLDARPASLEGFKPRQGPRNSFMFGPESIEDTVITDAQKAQEASNAPLRAVQYANTRLNTAIAPSEEAIPASPSLSAVDAALSGRPQATNSEPGYTGAETPRVNGFAFVDEEPTPSEMGIPVTDEEAEAEGRAATLKLFPEIDDSGPNPFKINNISKRENLLLRMVEKTNAGKRKAGRLRALTGEGTPTALTSTPSFATGAVVKKRADMTPAARMLAAQIGSPRREGGMFGDKGTALRKGSWTPTPSITRALQH